ncbi:MAG: tRNA pseudouridine(38-40) synthase TruA [Planctomycetota bacterium]|nr:tRNA pseudouridine(38-40) synthase TruA [Planctomycetota bacterium]
MTDAAPARTLRIRLEFDGRGFEGWQRQAEGRTVQAELEGALARVLGSPHTVVGSGRTDAGVHALDMVASFRTDHTMAVAELGRALDAVLPDDIGVHAVEDVAPSFHAQRDAVWKWYRYRLLVSRRKRPLLRHGAWRVPRLPPLAALEAAAAPLVGTHDFRSFANTGSSPGASTVRTLYHVQVGHTAPYTTVDVVGDGFLYKMVRTIVGTLIAAAEGPDPAAAVRDVLAALDRTQAGRAAPADGLCLMAVALSGESAPAWVPSALRPRLESAPPTARTPGGTS